MKAWVAEGGENFDKRKSGRVAQRQMCVGNVVGCRGGENCDKRNVFDKRNVVVESMGCRGGGENFDKRKSGRVAQRQMCVGYVVGCRGGGKL